MADTRGGVLDRSRLEAIVTLAVLVFVIIGCLLVLAPFVSVLLWVGVVCYSTWGFYGRVLGLLHRRRNLAAGVMTLLLAAVLIGPLAMAAVSFREDVDNLTGAIARLSSEGLPAPPTWVVEVPLVGPRLNTVWQGLAADSTKFYEYVRKLAVPVSQWLLGAGLAFGKGLLHLTLGVVIAYFLYRDGETVAAYLRAGTERIAGARASRLLEVIGGTVKGVVYGILGGALAQGMMGAIGYSIAGVPGPFLLGLVTCFLALVPMGPPLVWIPAMLWLIHEGAIGWAVFMGFWGFFAISGIDNIVKPYLISQGSALPFILVLLGVLGGVLAFGITGIFLGPTLLAIGYALTRDWTRIVTSTAPATGKTVESAPD